MIYLISSVMLNVCDKSFRQVESASVILWADMWLCKWLCPLGRKEVVEILLEAGMDPNSFDTEQGWNREQFYHTDAFQTHFESSVATCVDCSCLFLQALCLFTKQWHSSGKLSTVRVIKITQQRVLSWIRKLHIVASHTWYRGYIAHCSSEF